MFTVLWTGMQNITNFTRNTTTTTKRGRGRRLAQVTAAAVAATAALITFGATAEATDSFSFGVEREMKESGETAGTTDINIGVGELQECTISKSMDSTSVPLDEYAIDGNSPGVVDSGDYDVWKSNFGRTAEADFDGDGDVDGSDFLAWQRG